MTKQTVLGRVAQLAKADVDALVDQAADPQKTIDRLVRVYTDTVAEARDALAEALALLRLMEQDHAEDVAAAAEWGGKAAGASRTADGLRAADGAAGGAAADRLDGLARIALGRQLRSETEAKSAEPSIAAQNEAVTRLKAGLDRMEAALGRLRSRRDESVARSRSAQASDRLPDAVAGVDVLDPAGDIGRFEDKVRREEARARSGQEPAASALDAQFESPDAVADSAEVDARLARLKAAGR